MLTLPLGRISGRALAALVTAVRKTPARVPLTRLFRAQLGIDALRALAPDDRAALPFSHAPLCARAHHQRTSAELPLAAPTSWPRSVASFAESYRDGRTNPVEVVTRSLAHAREFGRDACRRSARLCGYDDESALRAAHESARRLAEGSARSELEGVPIAIKEEIDTRGFVTRMGSNCLRRSVCQLGRRCGRSLARCWRGRDRPNADDRVRALAARRQYAPSHAQKSTRCAALARRQLERFGGGGGDRRHAAVGRLRRRRFDPHSGRAVRRVRPEADVRPRAADRPRLARRHFGRAPRPDRRFRARSRLVPRVREWRRTPAIPRRSVAPFSGPGAFTRRARARRARLAHRHRRRRLGVTGR